MRRAFSIGASRLGDRTTPDMLALLATRQETRANAATEPPVALSPELGAGFTGEAGIQAHRKGRQWSIFATLESVRAIDSATNFFDVTLRR